MITEAITWMRPGLKLPAWKRKSSARTFVDKMLSAPVTYRTKVFKWKSTGPRKYKWRLLCASGSCPAEGYAPTNEKARKDASEKRNEIVERTKNQFPGGG